MAKQNTPAQATPAPAITPPVKAPVAPVAEKVPTAPQESSSMQTTSDLAGSPIGRMPQFKVKKIITLPLLKLKQGEPVYVKFLDRMFKGKELKNPGAEDKKKEPPIMANVVNLATGEQAQIMLGSVLQGILHDDYPNDTYVNKGFMIELTEQKRGRSGGNYNTYKVAELEL